MKQFPRSDGIHGLVYFQISSYHDMVIEVLGPFVLADPISLLPLFTFKLF